MVNNSKVMTSVLICTIFIFIFASMMDASYDYIGYNSDMMDDGNLNSIAYFTGLNCADTPSLCTAKSVSSPALIPFVNDLDSDGTDEIIIIDGTNIRLYHGKTLSIVDAFATPSTISNMVIYDIDNDTYNEMIVENANEFLSVSYNGTNMFYDGMNLTKPATTREFQYGCSAPDRCVMFYNFGLGTDAGTGAWTSSDAYLHARGFNSTAFSTDNITIQAVETGSSAYPYYVKYCTSLYPYVQISDIDNDGTDEFTTNYIRAHGLASGNTDYIYVVRVSFNSSFDGLVDEGEYVVGSVYDTATLHRGYSQCTNDERKLFTNSLFYDWDASVSNGLESMTGMMVTSSSARIYNHAYGGTQNDFYPLTIATDGTIVSNIVRAKVFDDTGRSDSACVLAYENSVNQLNYICANAVTGYFPDNWEFQYSGIGWNITINNLTNSRLVSHIGSSNQALSDMVINDAFSTSSADADEVISAYGTLFMFDINTLTGYGTMTNSYESPVANASIIVSDVMKKGSADMIALASSYVWYISDGYENDAPLLTNITICPSVDAVWKQNTTVQMTAKVSDYEADGITSYGCFYCDTPNNQTFNFTSFYAQSGAYPNSVTFVYSFIANVTAMGTPLRVYYSDVYHNGTFDYTEYPITISTDGVEYGDGCTSYSFGNGTGTTGGTITDGAGNQVSNNTINSAIISLDNAMGLKWGLTIFWLVIMVMLAMLVIGTSLYYPDFNLKTTAFLVTIVEVLMFIIGFSIGAFGWGTIIVFVLMGIGVLAFFVLRPATTGSG